MQPPKGPVLDSEDSVAKISQNVENNSAEVLLVRLRPSGWSSIDRPTIKKMIAEGKGEMKLSSVVDGQQIPFLHPDQSLDMALRYVDRWPVVPVVNRADFRQLEGVITQHNVLERYRDFGGE
jgi:chloride channel protein, CIC family